MNKNNKIIFENPSRHKLPLMNFSRALLNKIQG